MPRNKDGADLKKHTLMLFDGDWDRLTELYPKIAPSIIVRTVLRDFIKKTESRQEKPDLEINVD